MLAAEDTLDKEWHAQNARELGIDPVAYLEALNKITVLPRERIEAAARMLYHTANFISTLTTKWMDEREEAHEQREALASLREMVADMIAELDLQVVLQKIVERTAGLVGADIVTIHTYDPLTSEAHASAGYGLLDRETFRQHKPGGGKAVLLVASGGQPIIAEDVPTSVLAGPFATREGVQSAAGFPLKVSDKVVGVLFVNYREPHKFEPEEVETLASFGNLAAVAINAARSYEQVRASAETIRQLGEVGQSLVIVRDLESLLQKIAQSACSVLGADVVVLYEYQEETDDVNVPPVVWGDIQYPEILREKNRARPHRKSAVFKMLEGTGLFCASNAREDWAQLIEEWPQEEGEPEGFVQREGIASSAAVCLTADEERLGVLFVNHRSPCVFDDEKWRTIELFGTQAAMAIQNARSFEKIQRRIDELSVLNQIGQKTISSSTTLEVNEILELVHNQAARLMNVTNFYVAFYNEKDNMVDFRFIVEEGQRRAVGEREWASRKSGNGLTEYIIRTREPLLIPKEVEGWLHSHEVEPIGRPAKSWLGVPMIAREEVVGVIGVQSYEAEHVYDEGHLNVLSTIASQAAIAIENARLFQERKLSLERLETLAYEAIDLISATTYAELSFKSLEIVSQVLNANASLYICQRDDPEVLKLEGGCVPEDFKSRLEATCRYGETPFKPGVQVQDDLILLMDARSREERLEGFVLVQRLGTLEQPAEPFSEFDRKTLFLLAAAIGHALQKLRSEWDIRPPA